MKLKHLESALQSITKYSDLGTSKVNIELEQYSTSPHLAARMLYTAEMEYGDISGRRVLDMGCGTGMLGIGACMLGAGFVAGVDIDEGALAIAASGVEEMELDMDLICCDMTRCPLTAGSVDTVVMNPPFGTRKAGIDILFLERALEQIAATAVYSMHKSSTRKHILKKAEQWGVEVVVVAQLRFDIPATYKFHKRDSVDVEVDLIRLEKR
ncbi:unnamed protein product, partial [Discosporangium mesarthrocarpum]